MRPIGCDATALASPTGSLFLPLVLPLKRCEACNFSALPSCNLNHHGVSRVPSTMTGYMVASPAWSPAIALAVFSWSRRPASSD